MKTTSPVIDEGLSSNYYGAIFYKKTLVFKCGSDSTLIDADKIEEILDLVFSVCGPAGRGEAMAQCDSHIIGWQNIGPEICDLFNIKTKYYDEEEG